MQGIWRTCSRSSKNAMACGNTVSHTCRTCVVLLQVRELRRELDIHVSGFDPPKPIKTFGQAGFDHLLLGAIKKAGYEAPTAIQAQALPAALSGRDVLVSALAASSHDICMVTP